MIERNITLPVIPKPYPTKLSELIERIPIDFNDQIIGNQPPRNHVALQKVYEEIVAGQNEREVGVTFLTDRKDLIIPVYAVTGTDGSVPFPGDYYEELIRRLRMDTQVDTMVEFHDHPLDPKLKFSKADVENIYAFVRSTSKVLDSRTPTMFNKYDREARIYFAVGNLKGQYRWMNSSIKI